MKKFNKFIAFSLILSGISICFSCSNSNNDIVNDEKDIGTVAINQTSNGSISVDKVSGKVGDTITIKLVPNENYEVDKCYANSILLNVENNSATFSLIKGENTVSASFKKIENSKETIKNIKTKFNYFDVTSSYGNNSLPSLSSPSLLVVPVQFSDLSSKWTTSKLNSLKGAFIGTNSDNSNSYWESLKSYYYKSSYGKLDLNITITDVLSPSIKASKFKKLEEDSDGNITGVGIETIIENDYSSITINNVKLKDNVSNYDSNNDGYIDAIWFVYNEFDIDYINNYNKYWAYSSISFVDTPILSYANMGAGFLFEDSKDGLDAHTLIHETGHLLGLDDYYTYESNKSYSCLGCIDMMDYNVGDHNAFSKFALDWVNPYLVDKSINISLKDFPSSGECIILPSSSFNNSAFSEYYIIEYYKPTSLNSFDNRESDVYYSTFSKSGILVYHVDARLAKIKYNGNSEEMIGFLDKNEDSIPSISGSDTNYTYYYVGASNSKDYSYSGYNLIELVTTNNKNLYDEEKEATNNTALWKKGDVIDRKSTSTFLNNYKFNDGSNFNYKVEIKDINSSEAKLNITIND